MLDRHDFTKAEEGCEYLGVAIAGVKLTKVYAELYEHVTSALEMGVGSESPDGGKGWLTPQSCVSYITPQTSDGEIEAIDALVNWARVVIAFAEGASGAWSEMANAEPPIWANYANSPNQSEAYRAAQEKWEEHKRAQSVAWNASPSDPGCEDFVRREYALLGVRRARLTRSLLALLDSGQKETVSQVNAIVYTIEDGHPWARIDDERDSPCECHGLAHWRHHGE